MMDASELERVVGDLLSVNTRLVRVAAAATENAESPAIWRTLGVLRDLGPMRLGELARVSRVSQPTMTKLVNALESRGWVGREPDPDDGRAMLIVADPSGLAALVAWRETIASALSPLFEGVTGAELEAITTATGILRDRLERADAAATTTAVPNRGASAARQGVTE